MENKGRDFLIPGIKKNVFVLGLVSLFTDISSEMIYPLVPIFLTSVLGAPVAVVGLIEGVAESTASILKTFSGWLSDKYEKRKPFVLGGYSLSALGKLLLSVAFVWPTVLTARFVDRLGKGVRTSARDALIADETDSINRGRAFGFHRAMDTTGAVIGPLIVLILMAVLKEQYRLIFLLSFFPAVLGVALLFFFVKEKKRQTFSSKEAPRLSLAGFDKNFKMLLLIVVVFGLGNSSDVFLILRAKNLGLSATLVVLAYVLYNVVYASFSMPAGILSDRVGRKKLMVGGFLIFSGVYFVLAFISKSVYIWPLFAIYGLYIAATEGVSRALVTDMAGPENKGTALGLYHTAVGLVTFAASLIAGLLWTYINPSAPFIYGGLTSLLAAILFILFMPLE
ncbi:MFS transporter [Candidatus Oleimmundimicrobium sp.]|uniref:MFS transporter n=1 Tax=Candidatus Oleimmundimicrobium sp. TaxID=3060597 RepID=UPI002726E676|nr:MFS transporter [Candidatus Oleimmundimicrobium sp.]MDO8886231.1 MFS transporter [Candidatus Oleimmundimicrobium sp.]